MQLLTQEDSNLNISLLILRVPVRFIYEEVRKWDEGDRNRSSLSENIFCFCFQSKAYILRNYMTFIMKQSNL